MAIIVHENITERLDDYLERRLRNYEVITPPIPRKPKMLLYQKMTKRDQKVNTFWSLF